jgi:hypothetical protein
VLRYRDASQLPEEVLSSIAAYYRRVTTLARPMSHAIGVVMLVTLLALVGQIMRGDAPRWTGLLSLPFCGGPILLAGARVFPDAVRLGSRADAPAEQSRLARAICRDHLFCLCGIMLFVALQLLGALRSPD